MKERVIPSSQSFEQLNDWLVYFEQLHDKTIDLGLKRIAEVAERCELRHLPGKVILLAGTNGKGTTASFLEAYLLACGFTTGVFSSPHILRYNECVRINGVELEDAPHVQAFDYIEQQRGDISLTPFEFSTLAALHIFKQQKVDYAIIEVGMGGRGDSTNVVEPDVCVITTVNIDHQAFLGNDRETIGYEKAGIMRAGKPVVVGELDMPNSVMAYADEIGAKPSCVNRDYHYKVFESDWLWQSDDLTLSGLPIPNIPVQNVATALSVLQQLSVPLSQQGVNQVLSSLVVTGRFQKISDTPRVIIDVAHNVEAADYLAQKLAQHKRQSDGQIIAVCGMLKDKDIDGTLACFKGLVDHWLLATLPGSRGAQAQLLEQALEKQGIRPHSCYDSVVSALTQAKGLWQTGDLIIVFGSFVTIAQILQDEKL